jgi:hypothetical protein
MAKPKESLEQKVDRLEGSVGDLSRTVANQAAALGKVAGTVDKLIKEIEALRKAGSTG